LKDHYLRGRQDTIISPLRAPVFGNLNDLDSGKNTLSEVLGKKTVVTTHE